MNSRGAIRKRKSAQYFDSSKNQENKRIALHQPSEAKQVFGTQLLLETILMNFDKKQLLKFRCLNKAWNAGACKFLRKRKHYKVFINCPTNLPNKTRSAELSSSSSTIRTRRKSKLELLIETISRSIELDLIFPQSQFELSDLHLRSTITQNFLSTCGHIIYSFHASFPSSVSKVSRSLLELLRNLLFHQLPNLHQLDTRIERSQGSSKKTSSEFVEQHFLASGSCDVARARILPKLKKLKFSGTMHIAILKGILKAAVNLKEIGVSEAEYYDGEHVMNAVAEMGKTHLVSSLSLSVNLQIEQLKFTRSTGCFFKTTLGIRTLHLQLCGNNRTMGLIVLVGKLVSKILFLCAPSVEKLCIYMFVLPQFQFSLMPNLRKLYLSFWKISQPSTSWFPNNFKMSRVFPQLNAMKIQMEACTRMSKRLFEESFLGASYNDQVFTVRSIKFESELAEFPTLCFPEMFPNLVSVDVGLISNIPQAFGALWSLPYLKTLQFVVRRRRENEGTNENESLGQELESAFTGFSTETCQQLATKSKCDSDPNSEAVESFRVKRSVLDAKRLRELYIRIEDFSEQERTKKNGGRTTLLSHVTGEFAFKMCPQVTVNIHLHASRKRNVTALMAEIDPVLDYVTSLTESSYQHSLNSESCSSCGL